MARLYVGGLTGAVRPEEIQESFARAGATVEGVELMRDADGQSKGFAYVQVADREGAEKCIKLYNRTAWRGGRLRVEHASEAYMDRLRREWAERDGLPPPPPVAAAVAVAVAEAPEGDSVDDAQKGEGEEEGKVPKQERDKRYLRLRRKAGEKALVVDTLPVLLKGADAAALAARPGSKGVLKRPRRRAAKLVDFSAGAAGGASAEKSLKEIWDGAFGPMDALLAVAVAKSKRKRARLQEGAQPEEEEVGAADSEGEGDVAAFLEAGEDGELDFAWGDDDNDGGNDGEEQQQQQDGSGGSSVRGEEEEEEEGSVGEMGNGEMEVVEEEDGEEQQSQDEEEDEELAVQLREEEERNRRILSGILGGLGPEAVREGGSEGKPAVVARRERPPQALALVPRFDPTSEEAGALMAADEEEEEDKGAGASGKKVNKAGAGVPLDPSAAVAADVGALTDIYRAFRPEEGEEPVPIGAQDSVPFSFGFGLGAAAAAPAPAAGDALVSSAVGQEERGTGAAATAAAEEEEAAAPPKLLDWRSPEMVSVMWPTLEELEERALAFVSQRSSAGRGAGEQGAAEGMDGGGQEHQQRPQQQRPQRQPVDEGWRRERHNLSQDFKRKRRNAVKSSRQRQGK